MKFRVTRLVYSDATPKTVGTDVDATEFRVNAQNVLFLFKNGEQVACFAPGTWDRCVKKEQ